MQINYECANSDLFFDVRTLSFQEYAAKRHQEFVSNGQHDAQELLMVLLDAIHEVEI